MKTLALILAMTTLVIGALPAEAGKKQRYRDSSSCITIEQTGKAKWRPASGWSRYVAKKDAWRLVRADVVKQAGGEMRLSETLLERCDPVNVSERYVSCRVKARYCKRA